MIFLPSNAATNCIAYTEETGADQNKTARLRSRCESERTQLLVRFEISVVSMATQEHGVQFSWLYKTRQALHCEGSHV
jgi:hypothetical protein